MCMRFVRIGMAKRHTHTHTRGGSNATFSLLQVIPSAGIVGKPWHVKDLHETIHEAVNHFKRRRCGGLSSHDMSLVASAHIDRQIFDDNVGDFKDAQRECGISVDRNRLEQAWQQCGANSLVFRVLGVRNAHCLFVVLSSEHGVEFVHGALKERVETRTNNNTKAIQQTNANVRISVKPAMATSKRNKSDSLLIGYGIPTVEVFGVVLGMLL